MKKLEGLEIPDRPLAPVGVFYSFDWWAGWLGVMSHSAFKSAWRGKVFLVEKRGPRGGKFYAVVSEDAWAAWAPKYRQRVVARRAGEAARRLGFHGSL